MTGRSRTRRMVLIAASANLFVGLIKLGAGILVGSSAMLAEAAHSAADTLNLAFLLASLRRGERPADSRHPFGYGQERYFWSLLAAFGILAAGAGFSLFEGVFALLPTWSRTFPARAAACVGAWLAMPLTRPVSLAALSRARAFTSVLATSCSTVSPSCSRVCSIFCRGS